jgi:hypothetical protein
LDATDETTTGLWHHQLRPIETAPVLGFHCAAIRVYDEAGNVIQTPEHLMREAAGAFTQACLESAEDP